MNYIAVKDLPYDIFREMLKDDGISGKNKKLLILERNDRRYKEVDGR